MVRSKFFLMIAFIIGVVSLIPVFSRYQDLKEKNRKVFLSIQKIAYENKALFDRQHKLQNDPVFTESIARKKLGMAKEGEVVYKILPDNAADKDLVYR